MRLDTRGQECPLPTIRAVEAMRRSGGREAIVVLTDDPVCAADIPFQAARHGYRAVAEPSGPSEWTISLEPGRQENSQASASAGAGSPPEAGPQGRPKARPVLTRDTKGAREQPGHDQTSDDVIGGGR